MKVLKTVFIILIVLAALLVIVGLFMPSKFSSERSLVINAPQEQIFEQINNLKNWNNWNAWNRTDTNWQVTYSEALSGVGASYSWVSQNQEIGKGKVTITKSEPMAVVDGTMEFDGMNPAKIYHKLEPQEGGIKVTMGIESELGNNILIKYMFGLWGDKMVGGNYEKSLQALSDYVKANPPAPQAPIEPATDDSTHNHDSGAATHAAH